MLATRATRDPLANGLTVVCLLLLALFVLYPVFKTFELSLLKDGALSFAWYQYIFAKPWLRNSIANSLILGAWVATLALALGFLFAFLLNRTAVRAKGFLRFMATLPIISPPFVLTLSVILLFGKNGFITRQIPGLEGFDIYGLKGLIFVQTLGLFPIAYLTLDGVLRGIDSTMEDAALDLGASRLRTFFDVTLPLAVPGVVSAWLLVFVTSLADFANPMILAGRFEVMSVQAYLQFTGMGNLALGAAISNLLLAPCVAAYCFQKYYLSKRSFVTVTGKPQRALRELCPPSVRRALLGIAFLASAIILLLYATVLVGCFTKSWGIDFRFSLDNFRYAMQVGFKSLTDTLVIALIATPIAGILSMVIAILVVRKKIMGKRLLDLMAMLPFALPGTAVGIGYVLAFNEGPLLLTGTAAVIILAFVFRNMPVGIESAKVSLIQIDTAIEDAATNLGANSYQVFKDVTLPLIRPACFAGMAYVFVHCMTAVSAVIFLVSAKWNHLTVLILAQTEILRFSAAAVLCLFLVAAVLIVFWGLRKLIGGELSMVRAQA